MMLYDRTTTRGGYRAGNRRRPPYSQLRRSVMVTEALRSSPTADSAELTTRAESSLCYVEPLSAREREVLDLLTRGITNREIAMQLVISGRTVETHLSNIYSKLGVGGRVQAILWAAPARRRS